MSSDHQAALPDAQTADKRGADPYRRGTFDTHVSERHHAWLRAFVTEIYESAPVHHDFACGTGRVARMLDGVVSASHGYDTSEAMLTKARSLSTPGVLHLIPEHGELPEATGEPTLVTMFRLLLHASDQVRNRAMEFAAGLLPEPESGLLLLHNQGRGRSLRKLSKITARTNDWLPELSDTEVKTLCTQHGFEVLARQGFTLLSRGWYHRAPLSWWAPGCDDRLARFRMLSGWASDVVYVARRATTER